MPDKTQYRARVLYGLRGVADVDFTVNRLPHDLDKIRHEVCAALSIQGGMKIKSVDARIFLPAATDALIAFIIDPTKAFPAGVVEIRKRDAVE